MSDHPSPDIASAPSTSSTLSSSRRQPLPSPAHLHFADDLPSSVSELPGPRSAGRRTPQHPQRRNSRPISADPLIPGSPHERRASLAASSAYATAPSSATARRASLGRGRTATTRHLRREDAELYDFGEATSLSTSASVSGKRPFISGEEEFQHRLASIDLDLVLQALHAPQPRQEYVPPSPPQTMNTPPSQAAQRRTSSYGMAGSPLRESLQLSPSSHGTPDTTRDHKRGLKDFFAVKAKAKEKEKEMLSPAEEEDRLRMEEMQRIERIRHIHSALTHSTVSRAESAKAQFEARYSLLLSPSRKESSPHLPTFLNVVKWKKSVREMDRLRRRSEQATSRAALGRGTALSRADSGASSRETRQKSPSDPPTATSSRRASFAVQGLTSIPDPSTDTVSQWAEQLILAKHRRKRSAVSGNTSLMWESAGTFTRPSDWDFTATDILEYLACNGDVQQFVAPSEAEPEVRTSAEQRAVDMLESPGVGSGITSTNLGRSAPPSVLSLMSGASDSTGDIQTRANRPTIPPLSTGKRPLSSLNEDELDSPAESAILPDRKRWLQHVPVSAPDSPVSGRQGPFPPRYGRTRSGSRPGSISLAFGTLFSGSGSLETFGGAAGSSRQSLTGKMWAAGRGGVTSARRSLEEPGVVSRDRSPGASESENMLSGEDNTSGLEGSRKGGKRRKKAMIGLTPFNRREEPLVEGEDANGKDGTRKDTAEGQRKKRVPAVVVPELPKRDVLEDEEKQVDVEEEEEDEEYETKSKVLSSLRLQLKHMDDILAASRIRNLAQELMDMRDQTVALEGGANLMLPPLTDDMRDAMPRPRLHEVLRKTIAARMASELGDADAAPGLPRSVTMPLPSGSQSLGKIAPAFVPVSRSLSAPGGEQEAVDVVRQIEQGLAELQQRWTEVDQRLDHLCDEQTIAFDTHKAAEASVDKVETLFFDESRMMDRLDDRLHRLKTRNLGNSFLFSFLAGLAEVLLFTVWLCAKIIQLIFIRLPKFFAHCLVQLVLFVWWLIRWILFLDYLWP